MNYLKKIWNWIIGNKVVSKEEDWGLSKKEPKKIIIDNSKTIKCKATKPKLKNYTKRRNYKGSTQVYDSTMDTWVYLHLLDGIYESDIAHLSYDDSRERGFDYSESVDSVDTPTDSNKEVSSYADVETTTRTSNWDSSSESFSSPSSSWSSSSSSDYPSSSSYDSGSSSSSSSFD